MSTVEERAERPAPRLDDVPESHRVVEVGGWNLVVGGALLCLILVGNLVGMVVLVARPPPTTAKEVYNASTRRYEHPHPPSAATLIPGLLIGAAGPLLLRRERRDRRGRLVLARFGDGVAIYRQGQFVGVSALRILRMNHIGTIGYAIVMILAAIGEVTVCLSWTEAPIVARIALGVTLLVPFSFVVSPIRRRLICSFYTFAVDALPSRWFGFRRRDCQRAGLPT